MRGTSNLSEAVRLTCSGTPLASAAPLTAAIRSIGWYSTEGLRG